MWKYSNKRRDHIHFITQYYCNTEKYTGTRIVVFIKNEKKYIYDIDNFKIHKYKNPKSKSPSISTWEIVNCEIDKVIKKEMINFSEDGKLKMYHTIYESIDLELYQYYLLAFYKENINPLKLKIKGK